MSVTEWVLLITAAANAIAALLAWIVKLRWTKEYRDATDRIIQVKDERIKALDVHIEQLMMLNPRTLLDWYQGAQGIFDKYKEVLNAQLADAQERIKYVESRGQEAVELRNQMQEAYAKLEKDYNRLQTEYQNERVPTLEAVVDVANSSQALADSTITAVPTVIKDLLEYIERLPDFSVIQMPNTHDIGKYGTQHPVTSSGGKSGRGAVDFSEWYAKSKTKKPKSN